MTQVQIVLVSYIAIIYLGKVWIHSLSFLLWVNSRTDSALLVLYCNRPRRDRRGTWSTAILTHNFLTTLGHIHIQNPTSSASRLEGALPLSLGACWPVAGALRSFWLLDCDSETDSFETLSAVSDCIYDFTMPTCFQFVFVAINLRICFRLFTQVHPAREIPDWRIYQRSICNTSKYQ